MMTRTQRSITPAGAITSTAAVRALVPSIANGGSSLDYTWTGAPNHEPFNDVSWLSGITGIGFSAASGPIAAPSLVTRFNFDAAPISNVILDSKPSGTAHNGLNHGAVWLASSTDPSTVIRSGVMQ